MQKFQLISMIFILSLSLSYCKSAPADTPVSTPSKKIAFTTDELGNKDIFIINLDGSGRFPLTYHTSQDSEPDWSPDGSKVAFQSDRYQTGVFKINLMTSTGSDVHTLTNTDGNNLSETYPSWSPDGSKIAFTSENSSGAPKIYLANADSSSAPVRLTSSANEVYEDHAAWSPDGTQLVFMSTAAGNMEIYKIDRDGSNLTRLTNNTATDWKPAWSPDSTKIVFESNRDGYSQVYIMLADGSNPQNLSSNVYEEVDPNWSPDSSKIIFSTVENGNPELYRMNTDGTNRIRLTFTDSNVLDSSGSYQP